LAVVARTWVFDVDGCLVDSLVGRSLRPGAAELLSHLRSAGVRVHLWSAGGADYARERMEPHGVDVHFSGFHDKDRRDSDGRYVPSFLADPLDAVYVDDRPEDMPLGAEVIAVSPYISESKWDRGLATVAARAELLTTTDGGTSP
jgi:phosphoglycolate phosphatase-like HAD superfamily hydrolase